MNIEVKYKGADVKSLIHYGISFDYDEYECAVVYKTIIPYEKDIISEYDKRRDTIERKEDFELNIDELFYLGAYRVIEYFKKKRTIREAINKCEYSPLEEKVSQWLKDKFKTRERLSFFLNRCSLAKRSNKLVYEVEAVISSKFADLENEKLEPMRRELERLGFKVSTQQGWSDCMDRKGHRNKIPPIADYYEDFMKSETD